MNVSRKAFIVNIIIKIMFICMNSYYWNLLIYTFGNLKLVALVQLQSS